MDRSLREWLWKGAEQASAAALEAVLDYPDGPQPLRHKLSFHESGQRFEIIDERVENEGPDPGQAEPCVHFAYRDGCPMLNVAGDLRRLRHEDLAVDRSILAQRKDPDQYPEITYLGRAYEKVRVYREWSFGRRVPSRFPQQTDLPNDFLAEDGSNLALVLNRFRTRADTKAAVLEKLRVLYDGIDDFDIVVEGGTVQLFLHEGRITVPATRLSDGTLRYLGLLAILCHPAPPPLVCIEEPELGLHPDVLPTIAELLREASTRTQIIATTHSDALLDAFTDAPEAVVVTERTNGSTSFRRLRQAELAAWLQNYSLGGLWLRGGLGGTRW